MPIHDWTRVNAGTFHAFHNAWITHLQESLNTGGLPASYYALGEQRAGDLGPDVLTLKAQEGVLQAEHIAASRVGSVGGLMSLAESPPQVQVSQEAREDMAYYLHRQRQLFIRHSSGDQLVAVIEIVSRANRHSLDTLNDFVDKVVALLRERIHVVVIDLFPPSRHDPDGIHGLIWERMMAGDYDAPDTRPLTLVSYTAAHPVKAWIEPARVGDSLLAMPLFLTADQYITLPLELTYMQAWGGIPQRWRSVITAC